MVNTLTWTVLAFFGAKESYGYICIYIYNYIFIYLNVYIYTYAYTVFFYCFEGLQDITRHMGMQRFVCMCAHFSLNGNISL